MISNHTHWIILSLACGAVLVCGCLQPVADEGPATVSGTGNITYIDLEGGFYGIIAEDGTRYLPLNLNDEFKEDGLRVTFEGVVKEDVATIQQWGTPIEITAMAADKYAMKQLSPTA